LRLLMKDEKSGSVELEAEDSDDLWHLYNLIDRGDRVCGYTLREVKVSRSSGEERGGRKRVFLCIDVEDMAFQSFTERLRIKGRVVSGPEEMNIQGSYHSFAVGPHDRITLTKEEWLSFHGERLGKALSKVRPKVLVVTLDDQEAALFMLNDYEVQSLVSLDSHLPGKYVDTSDRGAIKSKYLAAVAEEVGRILGREKLDVIVAGPGFTKVDLIKELKSRFRGATIFEETSSTVGEPGVREVMNRGTFAKVMEQSALAQDTRLIDELLSRLASKPNLIAYGVEEVGKAVDRGAVETLMISEKLFKELDHDKRRQIESTCKKAERYQGKIFFVGSAHEKGRQLIGLGGIAALLRFAI
jgi:protein pelota